MDPKNLGYHPYWEKWCGTRGSEKEREELKRLFEKYVPPCIDLILEGVVEGKQGKKLKQIIPLTNLNMVSITTQSVSRCNDTLYTPRFVAPVFIKKAYESNQKICCTVTGYFKWGRLFETSVLSFDWLCKYNR